MAARTSKLIVSITNEAFENFTKVAERAHLTPHQYGALIISRFSDVRPERALAAVTAIPDDFFKGSPGRPPSRAGRARSDATKLAGQNPVKEPFSLVPGEE